MYQTTKNLFVEEAKNQALVKMASENKRERLCGRLEMAYLNAVVDCLPSKIKFQRTSRGFIKADYFGLNSKFKNVHIFTNNTSGVSFYDEASYRIIVVVKATHQGVYKIKKSDFIEKRLNLCDIIALIKQGKAKEYKSLSDALGL